jgi:hypothetical protein
LKKIISGVELYIFSKIYRLHRISLLLIRGQISSTNSHRFSSQLAAGFTHTAVEFAWINKDRKMFILGLHQQNPIHCKRKSSERVSQTFHYSYFSYMVSSYCLSGWIISTGIANSLQTHSGLHPHDFAQILYYSMSLDWQNLPAFKGGGFVELKLIYKIWCPVYYSECLRRILTCFLMMSGNVIQTHHDILFLSYFRENIFGNYSKIKFNEYSSIAAE